MSEEKRALRDRIIGVLLRDARERAEKSKRECADALGVSTSTITAFEAGHKSISLPELEVLAYVLETPVPHFLQHEPKLIEEEETPPLEEILLLRQRIIGTLLRQARLDAGISQKDLAAVIGCSPSTLSAYEHGERPIPLIELELAAQHLDLSLDHFFTDRDGPIGKWQQEELAWERFQELPQAMQAFIANPVNIKYLEVALKLSQMPVGGLRDIAEGLLEITY
jgi:transcriptional regulator with XRE-family HTH domain